MTSLLGTELSPFQGREKPHTGAGTDTLEAVTHMALSPRIPRLCPELFFLQRKLFNPQKGVPCRVILTLLTTPSQLQGNSADSVRRAQGFGWTLSESKHQVMRSDVPLEVLKPPSHLGSRASKLTGQPNRQEQ